jgi:hypothetical protein
MPIVVGPSSNNALDVITLDEAKRALNIDLANTDHDLELAGYITGVSQAMDELFGPIVQRSVVDVHSGGRPRLALRRPPVASIDTVVERVGGAELTLTAENYAGTTTNDYQFDPDTGILERRGSGRPAYFAAGSRNVVVTYVAGRFTNTATVDQRFKQGASIMLSHLWRPEQGMSTAGGPFAADSAGRGPLTFAVPNAVVQLLNDERLAPAVG